MLCEANVSDKLNDKNMNKDKNLQEWYNLTFPEYERTLKPFNTLTKDYKDLLCQTLSFSLFSVNKSGKKLADAVAEELKNIFGI